MRDGQNLNFVDLIEIWSRDSGSLTSSSAVAGLDSKKIGDGNVGKWIVTVISDMGRVPLATIGIQFQQPLVDALDRDSEQRVLSNGRWITPGMRGTRRQSSMLREVYDHRRKPAADGIWTEIMSVHVPAVWSHRPHAGSLRPLLDSGKGYILWYDPG